MRRVISQLARFNGLWSLRTAHFILNYILPLEKRKKKEIRDWRQNAAGKFPRSPAAPCNYPASTDNGFLRATLKKKNKIKWQRSVSETVLKSFIPVPWLSSSSNSSRIYWWEKWSWWRRQATCQGWQYFPPSMGGGIQKCYINNEKFGIFIFEIIIIIIIR